MNGNYLVTEYRAHYDLVNVEYKEESWRQYVKNYEERLLRATTDRQHHPLGFTDDESRIAEQCTGGNEAQRSLHRTEDCGEEQRDLNLHAPNTHGLTSTHYLPTAVEEKILPVESYADYAFSARAPKDPTRPPFGLYGYKSSEHKTFNVNGLGRVFNPSTGRFEQPTVAANYHEHWRRPPRDGGRHVAHQPPHAGHQHPARYRPGGHQGTSRVERSKESEHPRQADDDTAAGGPRHYRHQHTSVQHFPAGGRHRSPSRPDDPRPQRREGRVEDRNAAMSSSTEAAENGEAVMAEDRGGHVRQQRRVVSDEVLLPGRRGRSHVTAFFRGSEGAAAADTSWSSEYMTQYRDYWNE